MTQSNPKSTRDAHDAALVDYPLADCDAEDFVETEDINDAPVPYTSNKEV